MKITVFGATGLVGKRVIELGLAHGHKMTAFGRNVDSLIDKDARNENFTAIKGYVFDAADVRLCILRKKYTWPQTIISSSTNPVRKRNLSNSIILEIVD